MENKLEAANINSFFNYQLLSLSAGIDYQKVTLNETYLYPTYEYEI